MIKIEISPEVSSNGINYYVSGTSIKPQMYPTLEKAEKYAFKCADQILENTDYDVVTMVWLDVSRNVVKTIEEKAAPKIPTLAIKVGWKHTKSRGIQYLYLVSDGEHVYVGLRDKTDNGESYVDQDRRFYSSWGGDREVHSTYSEMKLCFIINQLMTMKMSAIDGYAIMPCKPHYRIGCWDQIELDQVATFFKNYDALRQHIVLRAEQYVEMKHQYNDDACDIKLDSDRA